MNSSQKLGIKVFYYYLSKKISIGLVVLVLSIIISSFKVAMILQLIHISVSLTTSTMIVGYFINGLFLISALLIIYGTIISYIKYIGCTYNLGENAFSITKGYFNKREVSIPYRQIQNIDIEQSFQFKMMGVCKLVILTAGNDNNNQNGEAEGVFDVIDFKIASNIKESILQKSNIQPVI